MSVVCSSQSLPIFLFLIPVILVHGVAELKKFCDPDLLSCKNITLSGGRSIQLIPKLASTSNNREPVLGKLPSWRHFVCVLPKRNDTPMDASPPQETPGGGSSTTSPELSSSGSTEASSEQAMTPMTGSSTTPSEQTTDDATITSSHTTTIPSTEALPETTTKGTSDVNSCKMLYLMGNQISGVYAISPSGVGLTDVCCDMTTDNGGWTIFQKRYDGSVDFYRNYTEYVRGFGDVEGEYWLGLDQLYLLAKDGVELRIDMVDYNNNQLYAHYGNFSIGSTNTNYRIGFSSYTGTAGEGLNAANGQAFSTYDNGGTSNCAFQFKGAWWYNNCYTANLNGVHGLQNDLKGIVWNWPDSIYMRATEMKLR